MTLPIGGKEPSIAALPLETSCKGRCPFRLCAPSFIFPASWADNAKALAPYVDEIELLFLESRFEDSLPDRKQIRELARIGAGEQIRYNVHLPMDISLGDKDPLRQSEALDIIRQLLARAATLDPTTWTLHVPYEEPGRSAADIEAWRVRVKEGLARLATGDIPAGKFSIETLDYPFEWVVETLSDLDFRICLDMGHLMARGENPEPFFTAHKDRISILHVHGVKGTQDHLPLSVLSNANAGIVQRILASFSDTVSVEVFSAAHLVPSMEWLEKTILPPGMK